jgi:hypothetical protein
MITTIDVDPLQRCDTVTPLITTQAIQRARERRILPILLVNSLI